METINNCWDEYNLWLEKQGLHEEEEPAEDEGIGYPGEWSRSTEDRPEPPPNFVGEYWRADE